MPSEDSDKFFESEDGVDSVTITLGLEEAMHLSSVRIEFAKAEDVPLGLTIERSNDAGKRFRPMHSFARNCDESFAMDPSRRTSVKDYVCETINGSVSVVDFTVVPEADTSKPDEKWFFSKVTNVRIKLSGLNDRSSRRSLRVTKLLIFGSCLCYGHAAACQTGVNGMISPVCECQHHTNGTNCDSCEDSFNDQKWRPAVAREANECKACNCSGRSDSCFFDEDAYERSGDRKSGGVCIGCQNSTGSACQKCRSFFFADGDKCSPCDCSETGSLTTLCDQRTGQCDCMTGFIGRDCGTRSA